MSTIATVLTFFAFLLGSNEFIIAKHDGIPGRRIGGGTRHEVPKAPRYLS